MIKGLDERVVGRLRLGYNVGYTIIRCIYSRALILIFFFFFETTAVPFYWELYAAPNTSFSYDGRQKATVQTISRASYQQTFTRHLCIVTVIQHRKLVKL